MDCDLAGYKEARYQEIRDEVVLMLTKVGWKKEFVTAQVPIVPISGWQGDNLIKKSDNMPWWKGQEVTTESKTKVLVHTLIDGLEKYVQLPTRNATGALRVPVSGIYKIKGAGDVLTGRVEQGTVKPTDEVIFLPTHTSSAACDGKVFSLEMHHKQVLAAEAGDNVGMNIKGLRKENMPHVGDIMILKKDTTLKTCKKFTAQVQVLTHPGELKIGYSPIAFVRTARSAVKMVQLKWKVGKETGGKKVENPPHLKANEMAEIVFEPQHPFVVDSFTNCEGLGRVAIMEGASVVMLGKVIAVEY
jgi:elongation factor 1-alpha